MTLRFARLAVAAVLLSVSLPAVGAGSGPLPPRPTLEQRRILFRPHGLPPTIRPPVQPTSLQDDFDVLDYELTVTLDMLAERIEGRCVVTFLPMPGAILAELVLDLESDTLVVSAVQRLDTGAPASFVHVDDILAITLDPLVQDSLRPVAVAITYSGQPREQSFGTLTFDVHGDPPQPVVFTLSEPFYARGWWPCKDRPDDKATLTMHVVAPSDLVAVSNGRQTSKEPSTSVPGSSVTTWMETHPIATYLVSLAVSNYEELKETYTGLAGTANMPVTHWVYPELSLFAADHFSDTTAMLEFFAQSFYEYPFIDEKYGHAVIPLGGAMEHQTATSYGASIVAAGPTYEFVVAHELAHQWWGNHVGPREFESVWLNEGFATYCESLWTENIAGREAYRNDMRNIDIARFPPFADFPGTVHAPPVANANQYFDFGTFGSTTYYKGAWVLHMLRWVLGQPQPDPDPAALFRLLTEWGSMYGSRVASTADFEQLATRLGPATPAPLDQWFFPQWLHRTGRPNYHFGWSTAPQSASAHRVFVRIEQVQAEAPFTMPLEIHMSLPGGITHTEVVWNDGRLTDYTFDVAGAPERVQLNPNDWVLKRSSSISIDADDDGWPDWVDGCPDVPNPLQEDTDRNGVQDACQDGLDYDQDGHLNEDDCAPGDDQAWQIDEPVLRVSHVRDSSTLTIDFASPGGQRPYVADIVGGSLSDLRADASIQRSFCLLTDTLGPYTDDLPPQFGGTWYLAFPYNGCVAETLGGEPDPCR